MTMDKLSAHNSLYLIPSLNMPLNIPFMTQQKLIPPHNDIVREFNYNKLNLLTL